MRRRKQKSRLGSPKTQPNRDHRNTSEAQENLVNTDGVGVIAEIGLFDAGGCFGADGRIRTLRCAGECLDIPIEVGLDLFAKEPDGGNGSDGHNGEDDEILGHGDTATTVLGGEGIEFHRGLYWMVIFMFVTDKGDKARGVPTGCAVVRGKGE